MTDQRDAHGPDGLEGSYRAPPEAKPPEQRRPFRAGDVVSTRSGEWVLACDEEKGRVSFTGWAYPPIDAGECELRKAASDHDRLDMLRRTAIECAGMWRGQAAARQLAAIESASHAPERASDPFAVLRAEVCCFPPENVWTSDVARLLAAYDQERTARQALEREIAATRKALEAALHSLDIALKGLGVRSDKVDAAMSADDRASAAMAAFGGEKP